MCKLHDLQDVRRRTSRIAETLFTASIDLRLVGDYLYDGAPHPRCRPTVDVQQAITSSQTSIADAKRRLTAALASLEVAEREIATVEAGGGAPG
jgi:hypothetical protein